MALSLNTQEATLRAMREHITLEDVQASFKLFRALDAMVKAVWENEVEKVVDGVTHFAYPHTLLQGLHFLGEQMGNDEIFEFAANGARRANELNHLAYQEVSKQHQAILKRQRAAAAAAATAAPKSAIAKKGKAPPNRTSPPALRARKTSA